MKHIRNIKDIRVFFRQISVRFEPHDNFHSFEVNGMKVFATSEAQELNRLMAEAWDICNLLGLDIYDLKNHMMPTSE